VQFVMSSFRPNKPSRSLCYHPNQQRVTVSVSKKNITGLQHMYIMYLIVSLQTECGIS